MCALGTITKQFTLKYGMLYCVEFDWNDSPTTRNLSTHKLYNSKQELKFKLKIKSV